MLIFNHVSYVDGVLLGAYFLPCGLAKASIADIPFFGTFCRVWPHTFHPCTAQGTQSTRETLPKFRGTAAV